MKTQRLGRSELFVTPVGFGAWAVGGGNWKFGWGAQDDDHSVQAIHEAVECGVNWIDTAPVYGHGHSEEVVGRALADLPASRRPMVFTKCGHPWDEKGDLHYSLKPADLRRECEESLRRLRVGVIDLYQFHWPQPEEELEDGWREMERLRAAGKVRAIGVCNASSGQIEKLLKVAPVAAHQLHFSLLRPTPADGDLPFAREHGLGALAYSPMGSGLLAGNFDREHLARLPDNDWRKAGHPHFQEPLFSRNLRLVELLREIGERHGKIPGAVAVAWCLARPDVTGVIIGAREPGQFRGPAEAATWRLTDDEYAAINRFIRDNPAKAWDV